jgi:chain length determinant protein (polysaccharide antigen chain regulator)
MSRNHYPQNHSEHEVGRDAHFHDDEINLFDLLTDLNIQKRWFFTPLITCVVLAVFYVSIAKPIYQVKSVVKPATENDLVELNLPLLRGEILFVDGEEVQRDDVFSLSVQESYEHTKQALLSRKYRRDFYQNNIEAIKQHNLYSEQLTLSQNFEVFNELFSIKLSNDKKDAESFVEVKFELGDAEYATELLNAYIAYSLDTRRADIAQSFYSKKNMRIRELEYQASEIRNRYYSNKDRRSLQLTEALMIAQKTGQKTAIHLQNKMIGSSSGLPLYMFGSNALSAEKSAMDNRAETTKNLPLGEEHFIAGLPEKMFLINKLKQLNIDFEKVSIAKIDEFASLPRNPIKPRKLLIVALSIVLGGFVGLMTALLVAGYKRYRKEHENDLVI